MEGCICYGKSSSRIRGCGSTIVSPRSAAHQSFSSCFPASGCKSVCEREFSERNVMDLLRLHHRCHFPLSLPCSSSSYKELSSGNTFFSLLFIAHVFTEGNAVSSASPIRGPNKCGTGNISSFLTLLGMRTPTNQKSII